MLRIRATRTGLLLAVVATGLVAAPDAGAITRAELWEFNECVSGPLCTPTSITSPGGQPVTPLADVFDSPGLVKLRDDGLPTILNEPNSDYYLDITADTDRFPPRRTPSLTDPWNATITFDVAWYGTQDGVLWTEPPGLEDPAQFLFLFTALRYGGGGVLDPAIDMAYVRGTAMDMGGVNSLEDLYSDCQGTGGLIVDSDCGRGFVDDRNASFQPLTNYNPETYLGFTADLLAPDTDCGATKSCTLAELNFVSFKIDWVLLQDVDFEENFLLVNSGYIVPEPGVILLLGAGALLFARRRRA